MLKPLSAEELKLINLLEENGNYTAQQLANRLDLPPEKVEKLKQELEDEGIILKYRAIVNWEKIESSEVNAIIQVNVTPAQNKGYDEVAKVISSFQEVSTCMLVSGSFDLLVEVQGQSLKDVAFFVADKLATIEGVTGTRTNFLLKRYKQSGDTLMVSGKTHRLPMFI